MAFEKTAALATFVADITGDGHLQFDEHRGNIQFTSKNLFSIEDFQRLCEKLFHVKPKVMKIKNDGKAFTLRYRTYFSSFKIAQELVEIGVPFGNKTNKIFSVPDWVLNGDSEIKKAYLRAFYTCEGSVYCTKSETNSRWRIELEQYKNEKIKNQGKIFMNQLKNMLTEFNVKTSPVRFGKKQKRKDGSFSIALKIDIEKSSFQKFVSEIGFNDKLKTKKLLSAIAG
jgi:hypothetical protein